VGRHAEQDPAAAERPHLHALQSPVNQKQVEAPEEKFQMTKQECLKA